MILTLLIPYTKKDENDLVTCQEGSWGLRQTHSCRHQNLFWSWYKMLEGAELFQFQTWHNPFHQTSPQLTSASRTWPCTLWSQFWTRLSWRWTLHKQSSPRWSCRQSPPCRWIPRSRTWWWGGHSPWRHSPPRHHQRPCHSFWAPDTSSEWRCRTRTCSPLPRHTPYLIYSIIYVELSL